MRTSDDVKDSQLVVPAMTESAKAGTPTTFEYLLNALESAGQQLYPADHGYGDKRKSVLAYVDALRIQRDGYSKTIDQLEAALASMTAERDRVCELHEGLMANADKRALAAEAELAACRKEAERYRFRHSSYIDKDGYEYGYCKVRWINGSVDSMLWASDEEIDAAIAAAQVEKTK